MVYNNLYISVMTNRLKIEVSNPLTTEVEKCPVCWNPMWSSVRLSCGHSYHLKCIDAWFSRCKTCPYCRHVFSPPPSPASLPSTPRSLSVDSVISDVSQQTTQCVHCLGWARWWPATWHRNTPPQQRSR